MSLVPQTAPRKHHDFRPHHHGVTAVTNFNASTYLFRYTKHTAINTGVPSIRMVLLVGMKADLGSGNTLRMEDQFRPFGRNERFTPSRTPHGGISIHHEIIIALPIIILCIMKLWWHGKRICVAFQPLSRTWGFVFSTGLDTLVEKLVVVTVMMPFKSFFRYCDVTRVYWKLPEAAACPYDCKTVDKMCFWWTRQNALPLHGICDQNHVTIDQKWEHWPNQAWCR